MKTSYNDQKIQRTNDRKINRLKKAGLNVGMPDRHYRHNDAESPDTDNLDDHDQTFIPDIKNSESNENENYQEDD